MNPGSASENGAAANQADANENVTAQEAAAGADVTAAGETDAGAGADTEAGDVADGEKAADDGMFRVRMSLRFRFFRSKMFMRRAITAS